MPLHTASPAVDQLQLPGQAAAPEGPVDVYMMYVMHHAFRRDLAAFAAAAPRTPLEDRRAWRSLAARWALFAVLLHHHHSGEDAGLWPFLISRADAAGRETLEAMEDEHDSIDPILEGCAADLAVLAERPDAAVRDALAARLDAAVANLGQHLGHEETDAMRLVQELMTDEEWHQIETEHFRGDLPLKVELSAAAWVMHGLPENGRRRVVADAPVILKVVWVLTRGWFARRERRIFGAA